MNQYKNPWSDDEEELLKILYPSMTQKELAKIFGRKQSAIRTKCWRLGLNSKINFFSKEDEEKIRSFYKAGEGFEIDLKSFAESLGRSKHVVCLKAKSMGLTSMFRAGLNGRKDNRKFKGDTQAMKKHLGQCTKDRFKKNGHPRGSLGMKHSKESLKKISEASIRSFKNLTEDQRGERTMKAMKTKLERFGTLAPHRAKCSWKSGWRELDGKRIFFRSRWEYNYAVYLQHLKSNGDVLSWEHEPKTFWFEGIKRGCVSYLPDFFVVLKDGSEEYHEVKGWMDDRSKTKIRRMAKYHPDIKLVILDGGWFKKNTPVLECLPGWEKKPK